MQVIYLDTLFFLNATVDYLLLLAAARVAGEPLARIRFLVGGILGGVYAVLLFILPFLQHPFYKVIIGLMILSIAYGKSHRILRQGLIFLALSFAFAGGILGISLFGGEGLSLEAGVLYSPMDLKIVLLSAAFCYFLLTMVFQNFGKHSHITGELVSLVLTLQEKKIPLTALVDTGNTLQDPISGQAVLVVEGRLLSPFFQETLRGTTLSQPTVFLAEHPHLAHRLRLLPYQAVGIQGLLVVLRVDSITVNGQLIPHTLVALSPTAVSDGGSYHGLIGTINHNVMECKK